MNQTSYQIATNERNRWVRENRTEPTIPELTLLIKSKLTPADAHEELAADRARATLCKYRHTQRAQLESRQGDLFAGMEFPHDRIPTILHIRGIGDVGTGEITKEQAEVIDRRNTASVVRAETKRDQWREFIKQRDAEAAWPELHNMATGKTDA